MKRPAAPPALRHIAAYGACLAAGTFLLQWLDYGRLARTHSSDVYLALVAAGFLALGIYIGMRVVGATRAPGFDGNPRAQATLGISARELTVLQEIAAGHSNKEIAARLHLSPATVKTHVANLYDKLGARRRTDATLKARELGLLP